MNSQKKVGQEFVEVTKDELPTLKELFNQFDKTYTGVSDPKVEKTLAALKEDIENLAKGIKR